MPNAADRRPRARELGIPFRGEAGRWNAITDVTDVSVGYCTILNGRAREYGQPAVRTGVTMIFPRGKTVNDPVFAGSFTLNGAGEMTGLGWVSESGFLESPIAITNTHSVGAVHAAVIKWQHLNGSMFSKFSLPVVAETYDGFLNDINGFHVAEEHVLAAIENAKCAPLLEGNVGGGTGMSLFGWKGGSGTSSRLVHSSAGTFVLGAFVQANFGQRHDAVVAGVPIGEILCPNAVRDGPDAREDIGRGSIIVVLATDAPVLPHQLSRLAKRGALGIARTGGNAGNLSGDIILAFSTANPGVARPDAKAGQTACKMLANEVIDEFFAPAADATEEAIINALVAAETMSGFEGNRLLAVPMASLIEVLRAYHRFEEA